MNSYMIHYKLSVEMYFHNRFNFQEAIQPNLYTFMGCFLAKIEEHHQDQILIRSFINRIRFIEPLIHYLRSLIIYFL